MKLGISSYTFGWAVGQQSYEPEDLLDEEGLLERTRQYGLKLLQIGDNLALHKFDSQRLENLTALATAHGIELEIGAKRLTSKRISEYARLARQVQARLIRFVIDDDDYQPDARTVVQILHEALHYLDGLTLGIENHDRFPAATLREIVQSVGDERVGICLDTANSLGAGEGIEAVAALLAPFTVNLHIKDFKVERVSYLMGFQVSGRPAGQGLLNLPALLEQLAPYNLCRTAVLELWTPPEPQIETTIAREAAWANESVAYLKPFFPD